MRLLTVFLQNINVISDHAIFLLLKKTKKLKLLWTQQFSIISSMGWLSFWFAGFMYIIVRESFWKTMISSFQTDSLCTKYAIPYSYVWTKWHMLYHGDIPGYFVWHAICFCISVILWCHCVWETLVENKLFLDCWQLHLNFRYAETDYFYIKQ